MASTPGKLKIREVVRGSRQAIWAHRGTLVEPVLAIAALQFVIYWVSEWRPLSWFGLAYVIPKASLAVGWHRALLLGRPMTQATVWRWTPAHWVFVGVMLSWQLPHLVEDAVRRALDSRAIGIAVWLAALYVAARLSVLLPAWAIGDERYKTPAAAWRLTRGHGVDLVFMTLLAFLWSMLLAGPLIAVMLAQMPAKGTVAVEPGVLQTATWTVVEVVGTMIGIGALSYAYRDLTAMEVEPGTSDVFAADGGGSLSGS